MTIAAEDRRATVSRGAVAAWALAGVGLVFVELMLTARYMHASKWADLLTTVASVCYLAIPFARQAWRTGYGRSILIGVLLCFAGDHLGPMNFFVGLAAFLVAHFAYSAACFFRGFDKTRLVLSFFATAAVTLLCLLYLAPHVPKQEYLPIFGYCAVISIMVVLAGGTRGGPGYGILVYAAAAFFISDLLLARSRFIEATFANTLVGYTLYYSACMAFGLSVPLRKDVNAAPTASPQARAA